MKKNEEEKKTASGSSQNQDNASFPEKTEVKNANASGQGAFERSGEDLEKTPEEEDNEDQVY